MKQSKFLAIAVLLFLTVGLLATIPTQEVSETITKEPAKMILSWNYPDEYGQGIFSIRPQENSTGSWLNFLTPPHIKKGNATTHEVNASLFVKLIVVVETNYTLLGLSDPADLGIGKNYFRLNISVIDNNDLEVFSQNNFTYDAGAKLKDTIWLFTSYVIFDFAVVAGSVYRVTISYEVFYSGGY